MTNYYQIIQIIGLTFICLRLSSGHSSKPHVIVIVADDLGWNDVGFHGSNQIPTPNIDALAYGGIILNNYYVSPICTPSRSALMTGIHPIHTGLQHGVITSSQPYGLPLSHKLLPQYMKDLGYETRMVGKWHLGFFRKEYTPTYRGFDSHLGYWSGEMDYYDHTTVTKVKYWGHSMRRGMSVAWDTFGDYSTDIFTAEAVKVIQSHSASNPLFLYLAHQAVHSANVYTPLQAPEEVVDKFSYIEDENRRKFAGMVSKLDESVGHVVDALKEKGLLQNSIILFTTDNGGPAMGFDLNAASNWPLRGVKHTLWEGGVRGVGVIWSPLFHRSQRVSSSLLHIQDWFPTLYTAAGGNTDDLGKIDGMNMWNSLSEDTPSPRLQLVHNIDMNNHVSSIRMKDWKFLNGTNYDGVWDNWFGPSGRDNPKYNVSAVLHSLVARAFKDIGLPLAADSIPVLRRLADVHCGPKPTYSKTCSPLVKPCLFNIRLDPCEYNNMADEEPEILQKMADETLKIQETAVPPINQPRDPSGDPKYWGYIWTNWKD